MPAKFAVAVWDHEWDCWTVEATSRRPMKLRKVVRKLEGRGYDRDVSITLMRLSPGQLGFRKGSHVPG